jgi:hypothetical protein
MAILPVRRGTDAGFALVVAPLLLASAAALWRLGTGALLWGAFLGSLLVLMFGAYAVAGLTEDGELGVFVIDIAVLVGGALTVFGSVTALIRSRRESAATAGVLRWPVRREQRRGHSS